MLRAITKAANRCEGPEFEDQHCNNILEASDNDDATLCGPESVLITGSPYKVIIRALQLVLHYVLVSIG